MALFKNFYADLYLDSILSLSPDILKKRNISGLILDIDNTLIGHNVPLPDEKVLKHLRLLESHGIKLCVVSNNRKERVSSFAEKIGVEFFVYDALKPRRKGYAEASAEMKLPFGEIAAIGDQVFTDVWGGKRAGCFTILTKPIHSGGEGFFIRVKRFFEKPFINRKD